MSVVVTAASGQLGSLVVEELLARGVEPAQILATGRSLDRLAGLAERGVRTAVLDYADPADGVIGAGDVVLLISGSEMGRRTEQHRNVVEAASRAGAARIVYTSAPRADTTTLVVAPEHAETEQLIAASGLPATILRNGWYNENYRAAFDQAAATGAVRSSAGDGRVSSAARRDYAAAAAVVLTTPGHEQQTYELGGDAGWTIAELVGMFGEVLGREIALQRVDGVEQRQAMIDAGAPEAMADMVVDFDRSTAAGELFVDTGDLSRLIGRPTTPMIDTVRTWA